MTTSPSTQATGQSSPSSEQRPAGPDGGGQRPYGQGPSRGGPRRGGGRPRFYARRKVCGFCANKVSSIDYKDVDTLMRYISDQTKIESRRKSGVCSKHQRGLATAIKRDRHLAMVPISRTHLPAPMAMMFRRGR